MGKNVSDIDQVVAIQNECLDTEAFKFKIGPVQWCMVAKRTPDRSNKI